MNVHSLVSSHFSNAVKLDTHVAQPIFCPFGFVFLLQYIRTCLQAKEPPHVTLVHNNAVRAMFNREISAIEAALAPKSSNLPLPLPPKKRAPTVSSTPVSSHFCGCGSRDRCTGFPRRLSQTLTITRRSVRFLREKRDGFSGFRLLGAKQVWRFGE